MSLYANFSSPCLSAGLTKNANELFIGERKKVPPTYIRNLRDN